MKITGVFPAGPRRKNEIVVDVRCENCGNTGSFISKHIIDAESKALETRCKKCKKLGNGK